MPTIADQLTQLVSDRDDLVDNLTTKGISGLTGDETFTELVPEVLNISGGVSFDNVSYGLTQPAASDYKYWIPVDTTKELKPPKMVPQCQIKEYVDGYDDSDNLELYSETEQTINYNTNNPNKYTKDYVSTYSETSLSGTSLTFSFYKRKNLNNNTFFMGNYSYDTTDYVQINKNNCYSDIYTTSPKVCCNTYRMRTDNYVYFVYNTASDTLKFTRYNLETQTTDVIGTYTYDTSFVTGTMFLHCYVKDSNTLYFLIVNKTPTGSTYSYKYKLFKVEFTIGSSSNVTLITTNTTNGSKPIDALYDLTSRYVFIGSMYELGPRIIDMNNDTTISMHTNSIKIAFESALNNRYNGSTNTITYLSTYNTSSSFRRMYCPSTGKIYCCYLARVNGIYAPTIMTPTPIVTGDTDWSCEIQFCYNPQGAGDIVTQALAHYDIGNKIGYLYTGTSISVLNQAGSYSTKNVYETTPKILGYKQKTSLTNNGSYGANVIFSNKTNIDTTNNVVIPILAYQDYLSYSFYKFYLDENNNYTVVPVDSLKLPAFYNNARYNIYVSDGTNWTDTVSSSDSDYIVI